jgi:hypothetical protein
VLSDGENVPVTGREERMASLIQRAIGAARLDVATYEEVEHDASALGQAMTVVVIATVASGIGSAAVQGGEGAGLVLGSIASLIAWFIWAFVIYLVGTRVLPVPETQADLGQLLRTTGFAAAPGVFGILGVVPGIGTIAMTVAMLWQLATMVIAVRQALDYTSTGRAVAVCVIGFVVQVVALTLLLTILVGGVMGVAGSVSPATVPAP